MAGKPRTKQAAAPTRTDAADGLGGELSDLRRSIDEMQAGLSALVKATETHTQILRVLLAEAVKESGQDGDLGSLMVQIAIQLRGQRGMMRDLQSLMLDLPQDIGRALSREIAAALNEPR